MADLTLTNQQLLEAVPALRKIGERDLAPTGAYVIAKAKRQANSALEDLEETRKKLLIKHATKDGQGRIIYLPDKTADFPSIAAREAFNADFAQLLAEPVTLSGVRPIRLSEIPNALTPDELFSLGPLFEEPTEPDAPKHV